MANVEVQLDVKAEYKQALIAIDMLGKALNAVQQRAKLALSVTGGAPEKTGESVKAEVEQKAAVEALSAAMKDAAAAAAMLAESVGKLTPALEAMGPQAEQVQQVLTLAEHYKQLAEAMGVAADAAAKYNASGAQQGETDARIQKLMEENQKLVEMVMTIREEYAAIVRRNVELNRARAEREENTKAVKEEMEVTQDYTYEMELSAMGIHKLREEYSKLLKEREKAAAEKNDSKYLEIEDQLKLVRKAMQRERQEMQLSKIEWLQQAQVAGQLAEQVKKVTGGIMGFGEALEDGQVDLAGMAEGAMSFANSLKAGLGPIGWVMLALEGLSMAINWYVQKQKEAEKLEAERKQRLEDLKTALDDAYAANEKLRDAVWVEELADSWTSHYDTLNASIQRTVELAEKAYKQQLLQLSLQEKDDDFYYRMQGEKLKQRFYEGEITEEELASGLDALKLEQAKTKASTTKAKGVAKIENEQKALARENLNLARLKEDYEPYALYEDLYKADPQMLKALFDAYSKSQEEATAKIQRRDEVTAQITETKKELARLDELTKQGIDTSFSFHFTASKLEELESEQAQLNKELGVVNKTMDEAASGIFEQLGWLPESLEEYTAGFKEFAETVKPIQDEIDKVNGRIKTATDNLSNAQTELENSMVIANQDIQHLKESNEQAAKTRQAKKAAEDRKKAQKEAERAAQKAAKEAAKQAEKERRIIEDAEWAVDKANPSGRLTGDYAKALNWARTKGLADARDGRMEDSELKKLWKAWQLAQQTETKADDELIKLIASFIDTSKTKSEVLRKQINSIKRNTL